MLDNLTLCIGIGVSRNASNDYLLLLGRAFIWTELTMTKWGEDRKKRPRFLMQMVHLFYVLLMVMGNTVIVGGVPFVQYLGPLNTATQRGRLLTTGCSLAGCCPTDLKPSCASVLAIRRRTQHP